MTEQLKPQDIARENLKECLSEWDSTVKTRLGSSIAIDNLLRVKRSLYMQSKADEGGAIKRIHLSIAPGEPLPKLYETRIFEGSGVLYDVEILDILGMRWKDSNVIVTILGSKTRRPEETDT